MTIKLYWCRGAGRSDPNKQNFGDYLSPIIVELISGRKVVHASIKKADMMAIGSILPRVEKAKILGLIPRKMHVWGAGTNKIDIKISGRHFYHAVRGKESLKQIDCVNKDLALGDPGLLASLMSERCTPSNCKRLGIIPHYLDKENKRLSAFLQNKSSKIIDVYDHPEKVISEIRGCDFIISSSMHGLIISDAFGIPNIRAAFREEDLDSYKIKDYYSIYNIDKPSLLSVCTDSSAKEILNIDYDLLFGDYERLFLDNIKQNLIDSFPGV